MEWQPIDTAPKGVNETVLTYAWSIYIASYHDGAWRDPDTWKELSMPPTHWMPLPPFPEE